jgi:hypothetical protein
LKNKDIFVYCIASTITIILNLLMAFVFKSEDSTISYANLAVIAFTVFMTYLIWQNGKFVDKNSVKFEFLSVWTLPLISVVWFINRVFPSIIPNIINWTMVGFAIVIGSIALLISIKRIKK